MCEMRVNMNTYYVHVQTMYIYYKSPYIQDSYIDISLKHGMQFTETLPDFYKKLGQR